jgi:hypothetical protein
MHGSAPERAIGYADAGEIENRLIVEARSRR